MHTLDVIDSALQWETERQNRLHQQAVDLKKKQAREDAPAAARPAHPIQQTSAADSWPDKVGRIPDMRSALIPLDEALEGTGWSAPFALTKADLEPWTSFLAGYNQSRLFLQPAAGVPAGVLTQVQDASRLDYAVRALLALKNTSVHLVLEPPVQINRQVEYHDLDAELRAGQGRLRADTLLKLAFELHQKQLAQAVEKGRELGDGLYEAMMGEGYSSLIAAWARLHGRKPSVDELHIMLSTGKVKTMARAAQPVPEHRVTPAPRAQHQPEPVHVPVEPRQVAVHPAVIVAPDDDSDGDDDDVDATVTLGSAKARPQRPAAATPPGKPQQTRRILWYVLHAAATAGSAAAITFFWLN